MVIRWGSLAVKQLRSIYDYYQDVAGKNVALRIRTEIKQVADNLIFHPRMGPIEQTTKLSEEFRSLVVAKHHKIIYFIDLNNDIIVIFAIWDTRQEPRKLLRMLKK